jgi:hypothetical protein
MMKKMILDPFFHCTFRVTAGQKGLMNFAQKRCRGKPSQKGPKQIQTRAASGKLAPAKRRRCRVGPFLTAC